MIKNNKNKLIHPTPEGIENFWKWFGDSKVVDDQGRPLIMYHGTRWEFDKFKKNKLGKSIDCPWSNLGFFFTEDYELASKFSNGKKWNQDYKSYLKGSNVIPVYLSMKKPFSSSFANYLVGYNSEWECNLYSKLKDMGWNVIGVDDTDSTEDIAQKLNDAGIGCEKENLKESVKNIKWKPSTAKG
jgi:hypothetical protein